MFYYLDGVKNSQNPQNRTGIMELGVGYPLAPAGLANDEPCSKRRKTLRNGIIRPLLEGQSKS